MAYIMFRYLNEDLKAHNSLYSSMQIKLFFDNNELKQSIELSKKDKATIIDVTRKKPIIQANQGIKTKQPVNKSLNDIHEHHVKAYYKKSFLINKSINKLLNNSLEFNNPKKQPFHHKKSIPSK